MSLKNGSPRNERELARLFDQREAAASQVDPSSENAVNPFAVARVLERFAKLLREPLPHRLKLALLEQRQHVGAIGHSPADLFGQLLLDQPSLPGHPRRADLATKSTIA